LTGREIRRKGIKEERLKRKQTAEPREETQKI